MNNKLLFFILLLGPIFYVFPKVLIITHSYNRPDFIEIQNKTFKFFLQDAYEFVVFSDAPDENMNKAIIDTCNKCNIQCIRIPQEIHKKPYLPREPGDPLNRPNIRHANCVQYSMDTLGFDHDGPVMVLDSDMFLIRPLNISREIEGWDIVSIIRGADNNVTYLWPGLMILVMNKLPNQRTLNFNCGKAGGAIVDSGGHSYYYLKSNPSLKIKALDEFWSWQLFCPDRHASHRVDKTTPINQQILKLKEMNFNDAEISFLQKKPDTISFLFGHHLLHYRAGTNYDKLSNNYELNKTKMINDFIDEIFIKYQ